MTPQYNDDDDIVVMIRSRDKFCATIAPIVVAIVATAAVVGVVLDSLIIFVL